MQINLPTFPLILAPTPLHHLSRFSFWLGHGCEVWIKRDDLTGMALGGNKLRKLEFLVADALAQGATDLVTTGAAQSNHCRQTAAAAAKAGLVSHLVLRGEVADRPGGNLVLDRLLGAHLYWSGSPQTQERMDAVVADLRARGCTPYVIPLGGSTPVGAAGYAAAWAEMSGQARDLGVDFDQVVFATSSGGTQAGLSVGAGAASWPGELVGISVDHLAAELGKIADPLTQATAELLQVQSPHPVFIADQYIGEGYGIVGEAEREAIQALARTEGILVDPVYTGRALAGLIGLARQGRLQGRILFWHTGGTPAIFAYERDLFGSQEGQ
ncbi:MAG: D-cysteine desulfhydrase family protein [Caldilineales bacterium]|nr:D-cysteine desulfhydrase family protein [Caldilineales bacterium]